MKRPLTLLAILILFISLAFSKGSIEKDSFIGVAVYRFDDVFISEVRNAIEKVSQGRIPVRIVDCHNKQSVQNDVIANFLSNEGCKAIIVNTVDRTSSALLIEKAKKSNVPIVFFNREPMKEDMARWDKVYYIGADAVECGIMAGEIFVSYLHSHPEVDRNNDGIIQYVMIKGEPGHQDTELRTEYTISTLLSNGIRVERLKEEACDWEKDTAYEKVKEILYSFGDRIEVIFCNNDDMALGAIEALKEQGYFSDGRIMPVVGVDGTPQGQDALYGGLMIGTVFNDCYSQAEAIYNVSYELATGAIPTSDKVGYEIVDDRYIWIPYKPMKSF